MTNEGIFRATHTAPMPMLDGNEVPPTGRKIEVPFCEVWRMPTRVQRSAVGRVLISFTGVDHDQVRRQGLRSGKQRYLYPGGVYGEVDTYSACKRYGPGAIAQRYHRCLKDLCLGLYS